MLAHSIGYISSFKNIICTPVNSIRVSMCIGTLFIQYFVTQYDITWSVFQLFSFRGIYLDLNSLRVES